MRRTLLGLALAVAAALPAAAQDSGVRTVDARWEKAMRAGDANAATACYAPDAVMWFPDTPEARGKDAILKAYQGFFGAYTVTDVALTNAVAQTHGDLSAGWGNYMFRLQPKKGGDGVVLKGRFTAAAKNVGGQWVYVADHASSEPAPPAAPAAKP